MNGILTNRLIRLEMVSILGELNERSIYFKCSMPDDGCYLNTLVVAYKGKSGEVRFSDAARLLPIDDFAERFLCPLRDHIAPDPYVWIDPWAVVQRADMAAVRGGAV